MNGSGRFRRFTGPLVVLAALLAASSLDAATAVPPWRWSEPRPHGNNIIDMAFSGALGMAVQVTERGQVYTTTDFTTWTAQTSGTTNALRAVAFLNNRVVITGAYGTVLYADDVNTAFSTGTLTTGATTDWLEGVAASSSLCVAVGDNAAIYTSANGVNWARQNPGTVTDWLRSAAYGAGNFVVAGENGTVATSPNGTNWTRRATPTTQNLNRVSYSGSVFIAVGDGGTVLSSATGGTNWAAVTTGATNDLFGIATLTNNTSSKLIVGTSEVRLFESGVWSNQLVLTSNAPPAWTYYSAFGLSNYFMIAGRTGMIVEGFKTNAAPYAWSTHTDSIRNWLFDLTFTNGLFITVGDLGSVFSSPNGIDWTLELTPTALTNTVFLGLAGNTNLLVGVGSGGGLMFSTNSSVTVTVTNTVGTNVVVTNQTVSTYGVTWTNVPAFTTNDLQAACTFSNLFVIAGGNGSIFTSANAINWTARTSPTNTYLSGGAAYPGGVVLVGDGGTILNSANAVTWTQSVSGTTNWIYRVRYLGGLLVAVGQNGTILTSTNGLNWASRTSGTTNWLNDVSLVQDTNQNFYIVGNQGTVLYSTNTVAWTNVPIITQKSLYSAATDGYRLLTVGIEGIILRAQAVSFTNAVNIVGFSQTVVNNTVQQIFQFIGVPDQVFTLDTSTNLNSATNWVGSVLLDVKDSSGTVYLLLNPTNALPRQFFRATTVP